MFLNITVDCGMRYWEIAMYLLTGVLNVYEAQGLTVISIADFVNNHPVLMKPSVVKSFLVFSSSFLYSLSKL